jgi:lipoprotein-releasing system permease protein
MNFEIFISKKLFRSDSGGFSTPVIRLAMLSIALGVATMILSIAVAQGFQKAVKAKVAGFEGHIRISNFDYNNSYELSPIADDGSLQNKIRRIQGVKSISGFAIKGGIIKANETIEGIMLKGVGENYNHGFFDECITEGHFPAINDSTRSKEVLISSTLASRLSLKTGDKFLIYFVQDPPRIRKFTVCGIYNSGFSEFDSKFIIGDIKQIRRLNKWDDEQYSGFEVMLDNFNDIDKINRQIYNEIDYNIKSETLMQRYPMIMDWLGLLDTNVYFIIGLMILISGITIISTLLILILEKTNFIGILKAMGTTTASIRRIFIYRSAGLILKGLVAGNIIGLGLAFLQDRFHIIPLDPESYYMNTVPVAINIPLIVVLNAVTLAVTLIMLLWPSSIISKISPVKAIRFE